MSTPPPASWHVELEDKPDADAALTRIAAWFAGEILDRPPVRFSRHNAGFEVPRDSSRWATLEDRWFDAEYQIESFLTSIAGKTFHGETFPIYWPNLGPNLYAAFYGGRLEFGEVTSWIDHPVNTPEDAAALTFEPERNRYFQWIEHATRLALERCAGKFLVGYTDLHPGLDCVNDWRGPDKLNLDFYDQPDLVARLLSLACRDFNWIFHHFDGLLKARHQLSVSWMGIPSFGKLHIPSCDFGAMISPKLFEQYALPCIQAEARLMDHNIFHLDGKDAARHAHFLYDIPEIQAIQWVQGVGDDFPIMQWTPLIKEMQAIGKGVVVDVQPHELEDFISAMEPRGLYLCVPASDEAEEMAILRRLERW